MVLKKNNMIKTKQEILKNRVKNAKDGQGGPTSVRTPFNPVKPPTVTPPVTAPAPAVVPGAPAPDKLITKPVEDFQYKPQPLVIPSPYKDPVTNWNGTDINGNKIPDSGKDNNGNWIPDKYGPTTGPVKQPQPINPGGSPPPLKTPPITTKPIVKTDISKFQQLVGLAPDGFWGPKTEAAWLDYQKKLNLSGQLKNQIIGNDITQIDKNSPGYISLRSKYPGITEEGFNQAYKARERWRSTRPPTMDVKPEDNPEYWFGRGSKYVGYDLIKTQGPQPTPIPQPAPKPAPIRGWERDNFRGRGPMWRRQRDILRQRQKVAALKNKNIAV